jgi:hypothetical protein
MNLELSDEQAVALANEVHNIVENDRYPFSPRIRTLREILNMIQGLRSSGVEILTEPHSPAWQPGRTVAEFRDSEGNRMVIGSR